MLHMAGNLVDKERISRCLQTLQSTSPNYLLLASLDATRTELRENHEAVFDNAIRLAKEAKNLIKRILDISVLDSENFSCFPAVVDPLRVTVGLRKLGLSGFEADEFLSSDQNVISEMMEHTTSLIPLLRELAVSTPHRLVFGLERLSALPGMPNRRIEYNVFQPFSDIRVELIPREAYSAVKRKVGIRESIMGKVCGELICPYPPGIPVIAPGEIITESSVDYLLQVRRRGGYITGAAGSSLSSIVICDL